jgi:hypothetical protein
MASEDYTRDSARTYGRTWPRTVAEPSLFLNFTSATALDPRITFSRGSQATLFDSTGTLVYAKHNLVTWSQDFSQADWSKNSSTIVSTSVASPITSINYQKIEATVANTTVGITSIAITAATQQRTVSFFAKPLGDITRILVVIQGADARINVNLVDGTFTTNVAATGSSVAVAGERFIVSTPTLTGATGVRLFLKRVGETDTNTPTTIAIGEGLYLIGAQMNVSNMEGGVTSSLTTYYPTTTAAYYAPRFDYDPSTLQPRGLLIEEQRTNSELYSEDFANAHWSKNQSTVSSNVISAPDGNLTGDKLITDSGLPNGQVFATVALTASTTFTFSCFAKAAEWSWVNLETRGPENLNVGAWFNLSAGTVGTVSAGVTASITPVGNGWYRCAVTRTTGTGATASRQRIYSTNADNTLSTGDGTSGIYIWGAQLEANAFATSYIPTTTTALTRNADVASMTGTNFSSWYNASEGTVFGEYQTVSAGTTQFLAAITSVSETDRITLGQTTTTYVGAVVDTGSTQASITQGTTSLNVAKISLAYAVNNFAFSANGAAPNTDTSGTVPSGVTEMKLGRRGTSTSPLNGWISRIAYYPTRLPNATLQALTA